MSLNADGYRVSVAARCDVKFTPDNVSRRALTSASTRFPSTVTNGLRRISISRGHLDDAAAWKCGWPQEAGDCPVLVRDLCPNIIFNTTPGVGFCRRGAYPESMNTSLSLMSRNPIDAARSGFQNFLQMALIIALAMAALLSAPVAFAQSSGLVAAYSFDEGAGTTAADKSGNGNNGTLINGATWSTTSKFGAAASFDGTNDRIDVIDSNSLDLTSGMTLEAWVRPTANSSYRTVVLKEVSGELAYSLYAADSDHGARSSGWVRVASASHYADGTNTLPLNVYSHIAVTYNGSALVFYVNGVATRSTAVTGNIQISSMPLRIGGNTIWGEYFQGQIDEVRVYNRALSQSEIQIDMVTPVGGSGGTADTTAPTIALTAPSNGATVSGTATLSANATDNVGVAGVQFRVDGVNVGAEDGVSPYSVPWNTVGVSAGSHSITALARDAAGNTTTSAVVTVTVNNGDVQAPTVSLTAPVAGATVSGSVTVSASASDNVGIAGVQFRVDGVNLGTEDTTAPYSLTWSSASFSNGTHSLTAVARDAAGNTTTSAARTVTVSNAGGDSQAPTVSLTAPAAGATVSGSVTVSASASDNVGIVGVQFRVDGVNFGTEDTRAAYSRTWDSLTVGNGTHSLTAVARDGRQRMSAIADRQRIPRAAVRRSRVLGAEIHTIHSELNADNAHIVGRAGADGDAAGHRGSGRGRGQRNCGRLRVATGIADGHGPCCGSCGVTGRVARDGRQRMRAIAERRRTPRQTVRRRRVLGSEVHSVHSELNAGNSDIVGGARADGDATGHGGARHGRGQRHRGCLDVAVIHGDGHYG